MSFKDIIKKSVLESFNNTDFSIRQIIFMLGISLVIGLFVFVIYRFSCRTGFYSKSFNISLIIMPVITATIILTIQVSVVVSLGMVGALSIVRFRTALKNPLDLIFMFWSISVGIVVGAGLPIIACVMSAIVAIVLLIMNILPGPRTSKLLNVSTKGSVLETEKNVKAYDPSAKIKSQSYNGKYTSILFIISIKDTTDLFESLKGKTSVISVSIVDQNEQQF